MVVHGPSGRVVKTSPVPPSETESSMNPRGSSATDLSRLRDGSQQIAMLRRPPGRHAGGCTDAPLDDAVRSATAFAASRSEEHTSELQSHSDLVCRLLLEKKKDM